MCLSQCLQCASAAHGSPPVDPAQSEIALTLHLTPTRFSACAHATSSATLLLLSITLEFCCYASTE